jgi:hypothetical protein
VKWPQINLQSRIVTNIFADEMNNRTHENLFVEKLAVLKDEINLQLLCSIIVALHNCSLNNCNSKDILWKQEYPH